jgi:hypothetical protein
MKKRFSASLLLLVVYSLSLNAQYDDFDISKYKLPDIKTSSLDLQVNLNHNFQSIRDEGETDFDHTTQSIAGAFYADFYHFRNSGKYQGSQTLSIVYNPNYRKTIRDNLTEKNNYNYASLSFSSINRFYNKSSYFVELLPYISYSPYTMSFSDEDDSQKEIEHSLIISAPVSFGHGRIEPVQDARLAIYILDELKKEGRILNQPDEKKILELAGEISKIKKKRFFDSRIRRIEEMQAIDSFLIANNIVSSNDIVYFTRLSDQWDYAYGPERNSGFSVNFGFNNKFNVSRDWTESISDGNDPVSSLFKMNEFTVGAFGMMHYSKPLSLRWQSDLSLRLPYDFLMTRDPRNIADDENDYNTHRIKPALDYSIRYLPNSRTSVGLSAGAYFKYMFGARKEYSDLYGYVIDLDAREREFNILTTLDMYYYFSPQLRLQAYWAVRLNNVRTVMDSESLSFDEINRHNNFQNYLGIALVYSIF